MRSHNESELTEVPLSGQFYSQGTVDVSKLAKLIHEFHGVCSAESGLPGSKVILVGDQSVGFVEFSNFLFKFLLYCTEKHPFF